MRYNRYQESCEEATHLNDVLSIELREVMLYIFTYMMCIPYSHDILSSNAFSFVPIAFLSINLIEYLDQMNRFLSALDCIGFVVALPT